MSTLFSVPTGSSRSAFLESTATAVCIFSAFPFFFPPFRFLRTSNINYQHQRFSPGSQMTSQPLPLAARVWLAASVPAKTGVPGTNIYVCSRSERKKWKLLGFFCVPGKRKRSLQWIRPRSSRVFINTSAVWWVGSFMERPCVGSRPTGAHSSFLSSACYLAPFFLLRWSFIWGLVSPNFLSASILKTKLFIQELIE